MDSFGEKHKMIQKLLGMLKANAVSEVESGLRKPDGEGDMHGVQVERVEVLPEHKMDEPTPEHDVITKELHDGGAVEDVNADMPGKIPMESSHGQPDREGSAHEEAFESESERESEGDIEPPHSMFESFLGRKKKK